MDRWQAMRIFVRVAEVGRFSEASRQLNMSPPAVTRAVSSLEEIIGTRLLTRTTRAVKLTEAGIRYLDDCKRILADIEEAELNAAGSYARPTGSLTITASTLFGEMYVLPILREYLDQNPTVVGRAMLVDRIVNIVEEGIDVAVRIGHLNSSGLSAARVGTVRRVVCGAPEYLKKHGIPRTPADLSSHTIIAATSAWASLEWRFGSTQKTSVTVSPRLFCSTNTAAIDAALAGWGITRVLSYQVGPAVVANKLQVVLADYEEEPIPIHVVHPEGRKAPAKVRLFVDLAIKRLRSNEMFN
jgi:DNA-binding transcriptional LysR family regulator